MTLPVAALEIEINNWESRIRAINMSTSTVNMPEGSMNIDLLKEHAKYATELLKVMSNEWRLLVLCHLTFGEKSVSELEELLGLSQSALSQHLAVLRRERLVQTRRSAQSVYYSIDSPEVEAIMGTLYEQFCKID